MNTCEEIKELQEKITAVAIHLKTIEDDTVQQIEYRIMLKSELRDIKSRLRFLCEHHQMELSRMGTAQRLHHITNKCRMDQYTVYLVRADICDLESLGPDDMDNRVQCF